MKVCASRVGVGVSCVGGNGSGAGRGTGDVDSIGRLVSTNYRVFLWMGNFTQFSDEMWHRKKLKPLLVSFFHRTFPFLFLSNFFS
jgi:hypothetical protein